ncbi:hypothetical protein V6N11_015159 [Hibiscus sabdariffa]|uniref:RNase H type-1 domain-containing protein n=1 Tax=Hibiscus sabdariffa TaxID=183260 RepID=A0ABR2TRG8_9ROSI
MKVERSLQYNVSWVKPPVNSLKFSVDGAVERGFGRAGVGACVEWFYKPHLAPIVFKDTISECLRECTSLQWEIIAIPKAANATVDKLAKSGIARAQPLLWEAMT